MTNQIRERLEFLDLQEADLSLLGELQDVLEGNADRLVDAFYEHLMQFPRTRELLADPEVRKRLLGSQRAYLVTLGSAEVDDTYAADRIRIGEIHERVGLEPRWYLGAYALYFSLLVPVVCEKFKGDLDRGERTVAALMKRLMLDAQWAMESYIDRREIELERVNDELAAAQRALESDLAERGQQLRSTERRARAAESLASVATLVAGVAHEIGTPMGVIRGHAEALEGHVTGERSAWRLRTIREQIDRISGIIASLLNIARPREAIRVPVDLIDVIERSLAFLSERMRQRDVTAEKRFDPIPSMSGDPDKLQQLFLNLILNAIDAMPDGGRLGVTLSAEADRIEIHLSDTGVGVPENELTEIFEPFYTTKPPGRGSGLGLVVAAGIVTDHGGTIDISSEPGEGTEFVIQLPASPDPSA